MTLLFNFSVFVGSWQSWTRSSSSTFSFSQRATLSAGVGSSSSASSRLQLWGKAPAAVLCSVNIFGYCKNNCHFCMVGFSLHQAVLCVPHRHAVQEGWDPVLGVWVSPTNSCHVNIVSVAPPRYLKDFNHTCLFLLLPLCRAEPLPSWRHWPASSLDRTSSPKHRSSTWSSGCCVWWDATHGNGYLLWQNELAWWLVVSLSCFKTHEIPKPQLFQPQPDDAVLILSHRSIIFFSILNLFLGLHYIPVPVWNGVVCWKLWSKRKGSILLLFDVFECLFFL